MTTAVLLTPGASATRDHAPLVAMDVALTAAGVVVERIDLPSSRPGPRLFEAIRGAASALAARAGADLHDVVLGGRSFGGRMCSTLVADGFPAAGLVLVSYPLHPPGRPADLRTGHFPQLEVPCLFVSGTRDAFGTPAKLEEATRSVPGPVTHVWIEGGGHGLRGKDQVLAAAVTSWVLGLPGPPG